MNGLTSYILSKKYVESTADSLGSLKGAPCTIKSQTETDDSYIVTFEWTGTSGTTETSQLIIKKPKDGVDGLPGKNGKDGLDGVGISKIEKIGTVDLVDTYRITFTDGSTFDYEVKNGKDGQGGGGTVDAPIESISVNGVNVPVDENKNVDITVPEAYDDTEIRAELANKSDTDHTHTTVNGHTVESDVPVDAKFTDTVYDDTQVKTQIQAVANGLMDSVGYSADYKSIDIIAKNSEKKSIDVAPIISHASITELSDVDTTNKATGKALVYNAITSKHEYADVSGTDEKVKMDASTDAKYLGELLDNVTIANENGELKVKKLDGQEVTITEINYLKGLTMNVMDLVNMFSNGGVKIINTPVATYTELLTLDKSSFIEGISYLVYVLADENHDNAKTTYLVDKDSETPTYFGFADSQRDFTTNPIDLATEITGKLGIANMDSDAIKALFTVDDTYKTETATNNAFSTHGAKALYDELLLAIGNKANSSDLTTHKDDTDIHVSTEDRTNWDSAKTHADSAHAPSNAQENVLEIVKVNNQEITPDDNKAINIDLTGYAEHDEIVGENLIPYPYAQPERTTNGITFTFTDDGSVIANGTATENADFSVCVRTNFGTDAALMLKPGIYAITGCPEGGSDSTYRIQVQFGDKTELKYTLKADYGKGFVFEVTEEYAQYACQIQCHVQKGYTVTDLVFKPMLVLGSVLKEYQPYKLSRESLRTDIDNVAELASRVDNQFATASGDYITVDDSVDGKLVELGVKGNSFQQTYSGKNLLVYPYTNTTKVDSGVTFTDNGDGSITINGTNTTDNWLYFWLFGSTTSEESKRENLYGKQLVVSGLKNVVGSIKLESYYKTTDGKEYWVKPTGNDNDYFTITYPSKSEVALMNLAFVIYPNGVVNNVTVKPMIRLATETDSSYEPYVGGIPSPNPSYPQTINSVGDDGNLVIKSCGKNLAKNANLSTSLTSREVTFVTKSDGTIVVNGTPTQATDNWVWCTGNSNFLLRKGKYLWTGCPTNDGSNKYRLLLRNVEKPWKENNDYGNGVTFELTEDKAFCFFVGISYGYVANNLTFKPMLRRCDDNWIPYGDDLYEPYHETTTTIPLSEPLRAIGDIKDEITYQDGKWGVLRRFKKYTFDGSDDESWFLGSTNNFNDVSFTAYIDGLEPVTYKDSWICVPSLCDRFSKKDFLYQNTITDECYMVTSTANANRFSIRLLKSRVSEITVDAVKVWLASNPITVWYELKTPVFEPFADQTLPYLSTYDEVTNIFNDDALSAEMTVKYPTTDASGVGSRNESRIVELAKDTDDKLDDVNESLSVIGKCKNLLNPTLQTTTQNGVTCANNGDGTYTLNGTATGSTFFNINTNISLEVGKEYKIVGCKDNKNSYYSLVVRHESVNDIIAATDKNTDFIADENNIIMVYLYVNNGIALNNVLIKPMLTTDLSATYDDFVPYTGDGDTLASDVAELKNDLGGTDISTIGDGTVAGAISAVNDGLANKVGIINLSQSNIGYARESDTVQYVYINVLHPNGLYKWTLKIYAVHPTLKCEFMKSTDGTNWTSMWTIPK